MGIRKSDYENYDYLKFWEDDKRLYEDSAERMALADLLSGTERKDRLFIDIGCGFGRLFGEYKDFALIIMIDYSLKNIKNARTKINKYLKGDKEKLSKIFFIVADATNIPLRSSIADVILTVRVVHHLEDPETYFDEVARILKNGGHYFLEFANKRNLKNILRFLIGRMDTSPFNAIPSQVGETILNFHPGYITSFLEKRRFEIKRRLSVSNFRLNLFKKIFGIRFLLLLERVYQGTFSFILWGPSIFLKSVLKKPDPGPGLKNNQGARLENILVCPHCRRGGMSLEGEKLICTVCQAGATVKDGIINFK